MMRKSQFQYFLAMAMLVLPLACSKEKDIPAPVPQGKTIPYSIRVEASADDSRATLSESHAYTFERGDRIYLESTDGNLYGFLSLASSADIGKSLALFEGELTCAEDFTPVASTPVSLTLVGPADRLHTISEGKVTGVNYTNKYASSLEEAIRSLSHFTGSGNFGDMRFMLYQQSSFLVVALSFDSETVAAGTTFEAGMYNNYTTDQTLIHSVPFTTVEVEGDVEASWVSAFPAGTQVTDARMVVARPTRLPLVTLKMADQSLERNTYYSFQRSTFMQNYFTVEATMANTKVTFNYAAAAGDGIQYSYDGFTWVNYLKSHGAITIPDAGDVLYFRGKRTAYRNTGNTPLLTVANNAPCYVYGDIMFLMCDAKYKARGVIPSDYAFQGLFKNSTWLRLKGDKQLLLSATALSRGCYAEMFSGCTGLTGLENVVLSDAPLAICCYDRMFFGSGITAIPSGYLPKTDLTIGCYHRMFEGCKSLVDIPADLLPATTLAKGCYMRMFAECPLITRGPDLPALTPVPACYFSMFRKDSKLLYIKCLMYMPEEMRTTNVPAGYDGNSASPSITEVETKWEVANLWSVINKWVDGVPNNNSGLLVKNKDMEYTPSSNTNSVGIIPDQWRVLDAKE